MKRLLLVMVLMFSIHTIYAQKEYLEIGKYYTKAKLSRKMIGNLKVHSVMQINDSTLEYTTIKYGVTLKHQIATDEVKYVSVKKGNYAIETGAGVGFFMLVGGLLDYLQLKSHNPDYKFSEDVGVIAGLTVGGMVLGTIAGACTPKYQTLYIYEKRKLSLKVNPSINGNYCGVSMRLSF